MKLPGSGKRARLRKEWQPVLEAAVERWSALTYEQILSEIKGQECYQVECQGTQYNVEVQILENTKDYIHVAVSVDDGSLPTSFRPLSESFIVRKEATCAGG